MPVNAFEFLARLCGACIGIGISGAGCVILIYTESNEWLGAALFTIGLMITSFAVR